MEQAAEQIADVLLHEWGLGRDSILTGHDVAALLGRNEHTVRAWRHHGSGPHWQHDNSGWYVQYRAEDVAFWAAKRLPGLDYAARHAGA